MAISLYAGNKLNTGSPFIGYSYPIRLNQQVYNTSATIHGSSPSVLGDVQDIVRDPL